MLVGSWIGECGSPRSALYCGERSPGAAKSGGCGALSASRIRGEGPSSPTLSPREKRCVLPHIPARGWIEPASRTRGCKASTAHPVHNMAVHLLGHHPGKPRILQV